MDIPYLSAEFDLSYLFSFPHSFPSLRWTFIHTLERQFTTFFISTIACFCCRMLCVNIYSFCVAILNTWQFVLCCFFAFCFGVNCLWLPALLGLMLMGSRLAPDFSRIVCYSTTCDWQTVWLGWWLYLNCLTNVAILFLTR